MKHSKKYIPIFAAAIFSTVAVSTVLAQELEVTPSNIEIIFDQSGSMNNEISNGLTRFDVAKESVQQALNSVSDDTNLGFRVYGHNFDSTPESKDQSCEDTELLFEFGQPNKEQISNYIKTAVAKSWTPIALSLEKAGLDLELEEGNKSVILISDGQEQCDANPIDVAKKLNSQGIKVHVVGLAVNEFAETQLKDIAKEGNGLYFKADNVDDLNVALNNLFSVAENLDDLTFTLPNGSSNLEDAPMFATSLFGKPFKLFKDLGIGEFVNYKLNLGKGDMLKLAIPELKAPEIDETAELSGPIAQFLDTTGNVLAEIKNLNSVDLKQLSFTAPEAGEYLFRIGNGISKDTNFNLDLSMPKNAPEIEKAPTNNDTRRLPTNEAPKHKYKDSYLNPKVLWSLLLLPLILWLLFRNKGDSNTTDGQNTLNSSKVRNNNPVGKTKSIVEASAVSSATMTGTKLLTDHLDNYLGIHKIPLNDPIFIESTEKIDKDGMKWIATDVSVPGSIDALKDEFVTKLENAGFTNLKLTANKKSVQIFGVKDDEKLNLNIFDDINNQGRSILSWLFTMHEDI